MAIDEIFRGRRILFVGCTGFVGKVALSMLLKRYPRIGRVHALVRPPVSGRAEDRFYGKIVTSPTFDPLHEEHRDGIEEFLRARVDVLSGDATRPLLGLDEATLARLSGKVDVVLNCAGMVRFNPPLEQALNVNTLGVRSAVDAARRLGAALVHVSTCFVAGNRSGEVYEDEPLVGTFPLRAEMPDARFAADREIADCQKIIALVRARAEDAAQQARFRCDAARRLDEEGGNAQDERAVHVAVARERKQWLAAELVRAGSERARHWGWPNTYCYTKALGEQIAAASGLRFTLVRPAIVESALRYPFPGWNEGFTTSAPLAFLSLKGHRLYPSKPGLVLDLIPVDMVAAGLIAATAATLARRNKPVYQLGSGDSNPLHMSRCVELLGICKRRDFRGRRFGNKLVNRLQSRLETVPVSRARWERSSALRGRALDEIDRLLERLSPRWGGPRRGGLVDRAREEVRDLRGRGRQVDDVFDLFMPFVHENATVFRCDHIRELHARMAPADRARIPWDPEALVWRDYWIDVHMEGLKRWIFPSLERELEWKPGHVHAARDLVELLDTAVRRHGGRVALRMMRDGRTEKYTYVELGALAARGAAALLAAGVMPGDRVLLASENRPEWPMAYFAVQRAGAACVPIDPQISPEEAANLARSSGARAAVLSDRAAERFGKLPAPVLRFADLFDGPDAGEVPPRPAGPARPDDLASLIFTSGTTGKPKGVMLSHKNFTALVSRLAGVFDMGPGDGMLSLLPLHHTFEFSCGLLTPLSRGAEITYLDEITPESLSAALESGHVSLLIGVPAVWQALHRRVLTQLRERGGAVEGMARQLMQSSHALRDRTGFNVGRFLFWPIHRRFGGRLRYLISGGSALPPAILEDFLGMGFTLYEGYGLTEAAPVLTVNRPGSKPLGVGEPLPGVDVEIRDPDEAGVGEVVARGPNVMAGYYRDAGATREVLRDGWLHTGDLGRMEGKRLVIVGRKKDVIIDSNGRNVYPDELEDAYAGSPHVKELSIVGLPDEDGGEKVACLVVPAAPDGLSADDVRRRVEAHFREVGARLPYYRRVKVLHLFDGELARTATRKVKRRFVVEQLQRLERAQRRAGGAAAPEGDAVVEPKGGGAAVLEVLAQVTGKPRASIGVRSRLVEDLGFDSLLYAELGAALEGAGLDPGGTDDLTGIRTVAELLALASPEAAPPRPTTPTTGEGDAAAADVRIPAPVVRAGRKVLRIAQRWFYERLFDVRVTGRSYIPRGGGFLVAANHASHLDMGLVKHALGEYGEHIAALAARDYFFDHPVRRAYFANFTNLLPMEREGSLKESLRLAGSALRQGRVLLLFPEGTRSTTGELGEFKASLGYLALAHHRAVLPMWLEGTHRSLPKGAALPRSRDLEVRIGPVLSYEDLRARTEGLPRSEAYRVAARIVQAAVEALRDGRRPALEVPRAAAGGRDGKRPGAATPANGKPRSNGKPLSGNGRPAKADRASSERRLKLRSGAGAAALRRRTARAPR
jgi:long-chain acyl-CoA synthetase